MKKLFAVLFVLALPLSAQAQTAPAKAPAPAAKKPAAAAARHDSDAPINVSADQFLADLNAKSGTYSGNVVVTQGDIRMHADTVRVNVVDGKPDKITATGAVVVDSPASGTATGDSGVYNVADRVVVLSGKVVLTQGKSVMRGTQLSVNLVTGQAKLGAAGAKPGTPGGNTGGRVQGIFTPPPRANSPN